MTEKKTNKLKILNDPIYGFITIPSTLICDLIDHPYFQRLRRISQMGLSHLVYPGAHHTRFHHAIGSMHLMQKAIRNLRLKEVAISDEEANALCIAILLHDIGHGAFSHALEQSIVTGIHHEAISLKFMEVLNEEFNGQLSLAITIFTQNYHRKFLYQLISSQLDMDRLDYLNRDSFYTGVAEGNISSERLITMLNVKNDNLVIEEKGIYSVEKFIVARRLMYWQVYLHKTGLVAEKLLGKILKRAKELTLLGEKLPASKAFTYFLQRQISEDNFTNETLKTFAKLDDYDVFSAIKEWISHEDIVISRLSESLINRILPKIILQKEPFTSTQINDIKQKIKDKFKFTDSELDYFVYHGKIENQAYDATKNNIQILYKNGRIKDVTEASDHLNLQALSIPVTKYYICYPKK
ncbi:MAG: HD domain-containing protein [Lutibacter sp.]|uniref:HD domain-containing protein n=1 Tax=Lutibacter sp. TaxID=1925666 RepID=UPI001791353F|nr:HD domain-containing protein [Lutibacter sp.]MBT8317221.1 HD domain-containing protein [Lutibacter sp.]NNJ58080.1 HD domain-containing protein [Lutibacter sp.]